MAVGQTQTFSNGVRYDEYRIGGTSLASPLYAGMWALAVQRHGAYGLANPTLYSSAVQQATYDVTKAPLAEYPGLVRADFNNSENAADGTTFTARWFDYDQPLTIHVRPGYDDVTGVGAPQTGWLDAVIAAP
jgi:hypothetical protein